MQPHLNFEELIVNVCLIKVTCDISMAAKEKGELSYKQTAQTCY